MISEKAILPNTADDKYERRISLKEIDKKKFFDVNSWGVSLEAICTPYFAADFDLILLSLYYSRKISYANGWNLYLLMLAWIMS